jgi:hypothetical protein
MLEKPASCAYVRKVSGRITVPVAADSGCDIPSGGRLTAVDQD